jgi:hypothetical protein
MILKKRKANYDKYKHKRSLNCVATTTYFLFCCMCVETDKYGVVRV